MMWPQDPDRLDGPVILWSFVATAAALALTVAAAAVLLIRWQGEISGPEPVFPVSEIGNPPSDLLAEARPEAPGPESLGSWTWVDRDQGLVQIPIEVAMSRVIEAHR